MDRAEALSASYSEPPPSFRDGLGERIPHSDPSGARFEGLVIRRDLIAVRSFEFAMRERVSRLTPFRHPAFAPVRSVERMAGAGVMLVSDATAGMRLSTILESATARKLPVPLGAALALIRQLVPAVASLHESVRDTSRDTAHGALAPERLVVTPDGRLIVTEYVLGSALEQLLWSREQYWTELRVALPRAPGLARFDHATDLTQIGVVSLALILGRPLHEDEYPSRVAELIHQAEAVDGRGAVEMLPAPLRSWLQCVMQLDPRQAFSSAADAHAALERAIADSGCDVSEAALEPLVAAAEADRAMAAALPARSIAAATAGPVASIAAVPKPDPSAVAVADEPRPTVDEAAPEESLSPAPAAGTVSAQVPAPGSPAVLIAALTARFAPLSRRWMYVAAGVGGLAVLGAMATIGLPRATAAPAVPPPSTGTLAIATEPPGAHAVIDGAAKGTTPLTVTLDAGTHRLELHSAGGVRTIPVLIKAGERASQYIDLPKPVVMGGQLRVRTEPSGLDILVDGKSQGVSPLAIAGLTPGNHVITARGDESTTATQPITIEPGVTASVLLTVAAANATSAPVSGWIGLTTKFPVQIFERGSLIGSSDTERVMVAAGRHEFELKNDQLGYSAKRTVTVAPGKVATVSVDPPQGRLAINAQPWAEVWVDGARVGETPIGNLALPIGPHEIVFRHPELGEQKQTATVTMNGVARASVVFRKP